MGLLDSLSKATRGEMDLTTEAFLLVITKPVLQKGCASQIVSYQFIRN